LRMRNVMHEHVKDIRLGWCGVSGKGLRDQVWHGWLTSQKSVCYISAQQMYVLDTLSCSK